LDSSKAEVKTAKRPVLSGASSTSGTPVSRSTETFKSSLIRYGLLALVALLCFAIAAFALEVWSAYAHYQEDYAMTGTWTSWFNGPILDRDKQAVTNALPSDAHVVYSLTGDLASVSLHGRTVSGDKAGLRYYLATPAQDGNQLFGTWVASNTFLSGRKQATTPVIIDQRTARKLQAKAGDTITLEVKLADANSNEVQGRFKALVTAVARPSSEFKGVALVSPSMERFVSSAQQVVATDFYVFGGTDGTPQKLANAVARDQIRGALRSSMVKSLTAARGSRATILRYSIAGVVVLVLGIYTLGELHFTIPRWRVSGKDGLFSMRRARFRTALDLLASLLIFLVTAAAGVFLANAFIRALMSYEPVRSTTIQTMILLAFISLVLLIARAMFAHARFSKREIVLPVESAEKDPKHG